MTKGIESVLYIDTQGQIPAGFCESCGRECYGEDGFCLYCERRGL